MDLRRDPGLRDHVLREADVGRTSGGGPAAFGLDLEPRAEDVDPATRR